MHLQILKDSKNENSLEFLFNNLLFLIFFIFLISNQFAPGAVLSLSLNPNLNPANKK